MSKNAFIIITTGVLVLGVIFVLTWSPLTRPGSTTSTTETPQTGDATQPTPLMQFDPGAARRIEFIRDGQTHTLARRDDGTWTLGTGETAWPIEPASIRGALAILSDLQSIPGAAAPSSIPESAPRIRVQLEDGSHHSVRFGETGVGGMIGAVSDAGPSGAIEVRTRDALLNPGPEGWRVMSPFPNIPPREASRIRIESSDGTIQLARVETRWVMTSPVSARCDEAAVSRLLDTLAGSQIVRFIDSPESEPSPLRLAIGLERDVRRAEASGRVSVSTTRQGLYLRSPADPSGATLAASHSESGPSRFTMPAALATSIPTAPRAYLHPIPTNASPGDIAMIRIRHADGRDEAVRRRLGEWVTLPDHVPADAEACEQAIEFLTATPGEPQESFRGDDLRSVARVELYNANSQPLEMITIGYTSDGRLGLRVGQVIWLYPAAATPELFAIADFDSLPEPRPEPVTPPAPQGEDAPSK